MNEQQLSMPNVFIDKTEPLTTAVLAAD